MVSTRNHPTPLPEPVLPTSTTTTLANDTSPSKPPASSRKVRTTVSRRRRSSSTSSDHESKIESPSRSTKSSSSQPNGHLSSSYSPKSSSSSGSSQGQWAHISDPVTLYWLLISLPLVLWDTGYILFRPYTFPGGILHSPLYRPYAKYGVVDLVYSRAAYESGMGFTAAQGTINLVETAGYLGYLYAVWKYGETQGEGNGKAARSLGGTKIGGGWGGVACLCGFGMSLATVSKTVLYCKFGCTFESFNISISLFG